MQSQDSPDGLAWMSVAERDARLERKGMDRFVSTFTNKIDAKARVSIPASFRAVLERDGYAGGIYCYPSLDAPALDAGGQSLAQKIDGLLDGLPEDRKSTRLNSSHLGISY